MENSEDGDEEILYRVDERTERIQEDIGNLSEQIEKQQSQIWDNSRRSRKNETKLTALLYITGAAITAGISASIAKLAGVAPV